ncbi:MAG: TM2 domain-containing protein [Lachnospiraceae bacterium]|nr:TM2 domain-containing protein [Lachnospiraceae bacterium]
METFQCTNCSATVYIIDETGKHCPYCDSNIEMTTEEKTDFKEEQAHLNDIKLQVDVQALYAEWSTKRRIGIIMVAVGFILSIIGGTTNVFVINIIGVLAVVTGVILLVLKHKEYQEKRQIIDSKFSDALLTKQAMKQQLALQQALHITDMPANLVTKRKMISLLLCIFTICGHKFYEGKIGMGIVYLFTGGLFGIGWIMDIIKLAIGPSTYYVKW